MSDSFVITPATILISFVLIIYIVLVFVCIWNEIMVLFIRKDESDSKSYIKEGYNNFRNDIIRISKTRGWKLVRELLMVGVFILIVPAFWFFLLIYLPAMLISGMFFDGYPFDTEFWDF